jgi:hypothetical protein
MLEAKLKIKARGTTFVYQVATVLLASYLLGQHRWPPPTVFSAYMRAGMQLLPRTRQKQELDAQKPHHRP